MARLIFSEMQMNDKNQENARQKLSQTKGLACYFIGASVAKPCAALFRQ
jgi:hypothetical protein